jgi:hypothetical protein
MKQLTLILLMTFSLMSFKQPDFPINPPQYKMRLEFIQGRCRMLEEMFEKQYDEGELTADFAMFYMQMVRSLDSCASDLKYFKVESNK